MSVNAWNIAINRCKYAYIHNFNSYILACNYNYNSILDYIGLFDHDLYDRYDSCYIIGWRTI